MCKMKVKLQKNVQKGSAIYRLRDQHFYTVKTCMSMILITLITSVSLILSQIQSGSEVSVLKRLCTLVSGVSEKQSRTIRNLG